MTRAEGSTSLADHAYAQLKRRIVTCELAPGARITERGLSAEMGLGLTPVREALGRLAGEGLVTSRPRQGYQVTPLTVKDVDELFEVWRHVCGALAEIAVRKADDGELRRIIEVQERDRPGGASPDPLTVLAHGEEVFETFCSIADNVLLADWYHQLSHRMARLFVLVFRDPAGQAIDMTVRQDEELRAQVIGRDGAAVREHTMRFNDAVHESVVAALRSHGTPEMGRSTPSGSAGRSGQGLGPQAEVG